MAANRIMLEAISSLAAKKAAGRSVRWERDATAAPHDAPG
jgi:hypothetical protein